MVVGRELVGMAAQLELSLGDAVAVASDGRAEVGGEREVGGEPVEAEGHVAELAVAVGHDEFHHRRAVIHDADAHAVFVGQGVEVDRFTLRRFAKVFGGDRIASGVGGSQTGGT
jgi:hypothetical protein